MKNTTVHTAEAREVPLADENESVEKVQRLLITSSYGYLESFHHNNKLNYGFPAYAFRILDGSSEHRIAIRRIKYCPTQH